MTGRDDHWGDVEADMSWTFDTGFESPDGEGDSITAELTRFVADMRALGAGPAPDPTPEFEALLARLTVTDLAGWRSRRHARLPRRSLVIAMTTAAVLTGTGAAAATDTLPRPAQSLVSGVVNDLTPFHIDSLGAQNRGIEPRPATPPAPQPATNGSPARPNTPSASSRDGAEDAPAPPMGPPASEHSDPGAGHRATPETPGPVDDHRPDLSVPIGTE